MQTRPLVFVFLFFVVRFVASTSICLPTGSFLDRVLIWGVQVLTCLVVPARVLILADLLVEETGTSIGSELVALGLTGLRVSPGFLALSEGDIVALIVSVFVISSMLVAWGSVATDSGAGDSLRVRDPDFEIACVLIVGKTGMGDREPCLLRRKRRCKQG